MSGAVVANEIRAIAGGLAGKKLKPVQVTDLMLDTSKTKTKPKGLRRSSTDTSSDRAGAEDYYRRWARSIEDKLGTETNRSAKSAPQAQTLKRARQRRS